MRASEFITEAKEVRTKTLHNGFTIDMFVNDKHVGQYTHTREGDSVRNYAEVFPEFRNKGYGTMLLLAAIKTAGDLGLNFEEDSHSLTPAMSRLYDELDSSGLIYGGSGAWAISPLGEFELDSWLEESSLSEHELVWGRSNVTTRRSKPKLKWRCTTGQRAGRVVSNVADCDKPVNQARRATMKRTRANTKIQQARRSSRAKKINTGSRLIARLNKQKR